MIFKLVVAGLIDQIRIALADVREPAENRQVRVIRRTKKGVSLLTFILTL
jgi:hypothetical protein